MEPMKTRGYLFHTTLKYVREGLHPDRRSAVIERITPETLRFIESLKPSEWYEIERYNEMLDAIAAGGNGDGAIAQHDLINCGSFAANEATNTFLRLLMKVLTPNLFAKKLPSLFERDFSRGKARVQAGDDRLICKLSDVEGLRHIAPSAAGWATFTLETMGKTLLERKVRGWSVATPAPNECEFELVWKT